MGLRSARRHPRATSETIAILLFALLTLAAALVADVPSSDPRLSVIYTVDDEGVPVERPEPKPDSVLQALAIEGPDPLTPYGAVGSAVPSPAIRHVEAAPLGGPATRAPPQS
jgi:hypothetical protein